MDTEPLAWELIRLLERLPDAQLRLFACDCAERVLPFFARLLPRDGRPRSAIETARRAARGEADAAALAAAAGAAEGAAWDAGARCAEKPESLPADEAAASAAAAAEACCAAEARDAAEGAAATAVEVALVAALGSQRADLVWAWMWHFQNHAPEKLADSAALAAKVGQELLDQYRQAARQEQEWQMRRARVYREEEKETACNP
jgi:hypothetical protein